MEYEGIDAFVWPEPMSTFAAASDGLAAELAWWGVGFVAVLVIGLGVAAACGRPPPRPLPRAGGGVWVAALVGCLVPFFVHLVEGTAARPEVPADAMTVEVRAYDWRWEFEHENGLTDGSLRVPVDRPVRLRIRSMGTREHPARIHGFSIPAARIQADVVPGRVTELWFEATRTGVYQIYCDDFCGTGHSRMLSTLVVMSEEEWDQPSGCFIGPPDGLTVVEWGARVFEQNGCPACHAPDVDLVGPSLGGLAGSERPLEDGSVVVAKEEYLRTAIIDPQAQIAEGWTGAAMPSFPNLPPRQIDALVAYLISLRGEAITAPARR